MSRLPKVIAGLLILLAAGLLVNRLGGSPTAAPPPPTPMPQLPMPLPTELDWMLTPSSTPTLTNTPDAPATQIALLTPSPTPVDPPPYYALADSGQTIYATPPYTLELTARLDETKHPAKCEAAWWDWGDGARDQLPCPDSTTSEYKGRHTYTKYGIYHTRLVMTLSSGWNTADVSNTQTLALTANRPSASFLRASFSTAIWILTIVGVIVAVRWLRKRGVWRARAGIFLVLLWLFTYVPPFSFVPNPLGLYWARFGGYYHDLRLPFYNGFVVATSPEGQVAPRLDTLLGQTGLDPLDPVQPLSGYEFIGVALPKSYGRAGDYTQIVTELIYADGTRRTSAIPAYQRNAFGVYRGLWAWRSNYYGGMLGMSRLFTTHDEFPGTRFPLEEDLVHLSAPRLLPLHPEAQKLEWANVSNWLMGHGAGQRKLAWSPKGDEFLMTRLSEDNGRQDLFLVGLDGSRPVRIAQNVVNYDWSPDGLYIVYNQALDGFPVYVVTHEGEDRREVVREVVRPDTVALPGISREGVWYVGQDHARVAPFGGGESKQVINSQHVGSWATVRPAPDGRRIAYIQDGHVYLQQIDGGALTNPGMGMIQDLSWSPDSKRLAAVGNLTTVTILSKEGEIMSRIPVAPQESVASVPQWSPDGRYIFVQTYPFYGRRIVAVDTITGQAWDLTKPRWDPWFAMHPDGKWLLLSNGRGGFWRSDLELRRP